MRVGSLKTRLAGGVATVVVLALSANAAQLVLTARGRLRERLESNARLFARLATEPLCRAFDTFHASGFFRFRQIAEDLGRRAPDVVWFEIRDVEGRRLFHSAELAPGAAAPPAVAGAALKEALRQIEPSESRGSQAEGEILQIVVPYVEDFGRHRLGVIYGVGYGSLDGEVRRYAAGTILVTLASIALAAGLGIVIANRVTRPLAELTRGAAEIAGGRFASRVDVRSGDELQTVGEAFNDMARHVERSLAERERLIAELERRNAELERFTYTVSHDLRSPLVTVQGFLGAVESAVREGRVERVSEDVARIRAAADRMDQLLRELLALSRVGRVAKAVERVPFDAVVREAITVVAGRLAAAGVEVEVADDLPDVWCDRPRLVEVVQNLLDNAAKFKGPQLRPRVRVGWRREGPVFTVSDDGIGIEPRHHETVFGLFDRLDPRIEGTGVGLALVRRIVEVHGGRVWVESEGTGCGATFCFTLADGEGRDPARR